MSKMSFEKLIIWQKSMILAKRVFVLTKTFPVSETYGLVSQMRRSSQSIPTNIAEGSLRKTDKDFAHFIAIAQGSCGELKTQLFFSRDFDFLSHQLFEELMAQTNEIGKMLNGFYYSLKTKG